MAKTKSNSHSAYSDIKIFPVGLHREVKAKVIDFIPKKNQEEARRLLRTGEENAVIFARVSRSSAGLDTITAEIDEEGAAQFHQKWTVSVEGYGHKSVGEHAIIQMAVENVSSEDGDRITDNRLASYTEFSARFKGRQSQGYFTPQSVLDNKELHKLWDEIHEFIFATCDALTEKAKAWVLTPEAQDLFPELRQGYYNPEETEKAWQSRLIKHAADQFKNLLPASRVTSIGVTVNATEGENLIRKLISSTSVSTREIGRMFKAASLKTAPTLVKYADFNPYLASLDLRRQKIIKEFGLDGDAGIRGSGDAAETNLVTDKDNEALILAAFLFESSDTGSYQELVAKLSKLGKAAKEKMFSIILEDRVSFKDFETGKVISDGLTSHDMPPRAFEFDGGYIYELPHMTYGDWRDFKRHRIQSYIAKPLNIKWGHHIPPLAYILDRSQDKQFHGTVKTVEEVVRKAEYLFKQVKKVNKVDARYAVLRLHYRPAIAKFNIRESFHLLRLRTGDTAHAFVRRLMWPTYDLLMKKHPSIASRMKLRGKRIKIAFP